MNTQSPRGTLSAEDKKRIRTIVIHGLIGVVLTLISEIFLKLDYGAVTPIITIGLSFISLTLTQYLDGPSASTLKIQQLEELVQTLQQSTPQQNTSPTSPNEPQ